MRRDVTGLPRLTLERQHDTKARRSWAEHPPDGATVIESGGIVIDKAEGVPVAAVMTGYAAQADALATALGHVTWYEMHKQASPGRLSGIGAPHRTFGVTPPKPLRQQWSASRSSFDRQYPDVTAQLNDIAERSNVVFASVAPHAYAHTIESAEAIPPIWRLGSTPWTSGIINNNCALPYHTDSGNLVESWSAMLTCRRFCEGGWLHLADYDVWLAIPNGSIAVFDGQSVIHGVSPFRLTRPSGYRYTIVYYAKRDLTRCASTLDDEVRRGQVAATKSSDRQLREATTDG